MTNYTLTSPALAKEKGFFFFIFDIDLKVNFPQY